MWVGRDGRVVNDGVKNLLWHWLKIEDHLRNGSREYIGIRMTGNVHIGGEEEVGGEIEHVY